MQKFTFGAITLFCFVLAIFGFNLKLNHSQTNPTTNTTSNSNSNYTIENITIVYPNPESGILNLHCFDDLKSPITVKAVNVKDMVVKSLNSLVTEGSEKFKYIRMSTSDLEKGKYTETPVKTEFGYHVILLEDSRPLTPPPFEQIKPQLAQRAQQQQIEKMVAELRAKAKVE